MKQRFSSELKIILAATVIMLTLFTAVMGVQIFKNDEKNMTFVYNSARVESARQVNICDIF